VIIGSTSEWRSQLVEPRAFAAYKCALYYDFAPIESFLLSMNGNGDGNNDQLNEARWYRGTALLEWILDFIPSFGSPLRYNEDGSINDDDNAPLFCNHHMALSLLALRYEFSKGKGSDGDSNGYGSMNLKGYPSPSHTDYESLCDFAHETFEYLCAFYGFGLPSRIFNKRLHPHRLQKELHHDNNNNTNDDIIETCGEGSKEWRHIHDVIINDINEALKHRDNGRNE
jgi:hypothetical protein